MKIFAIILVVIVILASWIAFSKSRGTQKVSILSDSSERPKPASPDIYLGLRKQMLESSRAKLGLPSASEPNQPWAVLMDWGISTGSATVVAISDGNASVYLSSGGGYMGGFSHDLIRKAAQVTVAAAVEVESQMHQTADYPLPQNGEVIFYALTDNGIITASADKKNLKDGHSPFSKLANAAQNVITQYRLIQENK